jgi:triacylglycerol lipase
VIPVFKNALYWAHDYSYLTKMQFKSLVSSDIVTSFRNTTGSPILLLPGIYENWHFMKPVASVLAEHGYDVHVIEGLGYNKGTIEEMAAIVSEYIIKQEFSSLSIVAHSKGGLVGKHVLSTYQGSTDITKLITVNTPFSGSRYASFIPFKSIRIFSPQSDILTALSLNTLTNAKIVSIYGMFDPHIPGGSYLQGAKNVQLETYGHFRTLQDPIVHTAILQNLN